MPFFGTSGKQGNAFYAMNMEPNRGKSAKKANKTSLAACIECGTLVSGAHICFFCQTPLHPSCGRRFDDGGTGRPCCSECVDSDEEDDSSEDVVALESSMSASIAIEAAVANAQVGTAASSSTSSVQLVESRSASSNTVLTEHLPTPSRLSEPRKLKKRPPIGQKKPKKQPKKKPRLVAKRIAEYPDQGLKQVDGWLFCEPCHVELCPESSSVKRHTKAEAHIAKLADAARRRSHRPTLMTRIDQWFTDNDAEGSSLPSRQKLFRFSLLRFLLAAGIPLNVLDTEECKEFLNEYSKGAVNRTVLSNLVPCVEQMEKELCRDEMKGKSISIIFDGTTHVAEVCAVVVRWADGLTVQQRLIHLGFYEQSFRHQHIAAVLTTVCAQEYNVHFRQVLGFHRDRAASNNAAMQLLALQYPAAEDLPCLSHTLNHCGEKLIDAAPTLYKFAKALQGLLAHSLKATQCWRAIVGTSFPAYSATRWWSQYDCLCYLHEHYEQLAPFLADDALDRSGAYYKTMTEIWNEPFHRIELQLQLITVVTIGKDFREATYHLEGDGPLAFVTYDELLKIATERDTTFPEMAYPAIQDKATELARQLHALGNLGAAVEQIHPGLIDTARQIGAAAFDYFTSRIWEGVLEHQVLLFKATRLANPIRMRDLNPSAEDVARDLQRVGRHCDVNGMIEELPRYQALLRGMRAAPTLESLLEFWRTKQGELPHWYAFVERLLLWQPSSAAAERVFSLLNNTFGTDRAHTKNDYVAASVMRQYNESFRRRARENAL